MARWKYGQKNTYPGGNLKIVCLDGALLNPGDVSWQPIRNLGEFVTYADTAPGQFSERVKGAEVVLVNKTPVKAADIGALEKCKLVGALATGVNNLDLSALDKAGIKACNVPANGPGDIAQHAFALLLELVRDVSSHSQGVKSGQWNRNGQWCYWQKPPLSLCGLVMGILGFGEIGQITGRIAHACDMEVIACSPSKKARTNYPFKWVDQDDLWRQADVISLHCPLTPQTDKIINADSISRMPTGIIIINTARGGLVDEEAVTSALYSGKLAGFGTDVLSSEPPLPDNPLLHAPNTLITPHMAWATARSRQNIIDIMAANISAFFNNQPQNLVN